MRAAICVPTIKGPYPQFIEAMEAEVPILEAAGIEHAINFEVGSAYISWARANCMWDALKIMPDCVVFIDHDMGWKPGDLTRLIQTEGPVISGAYRFKHPPDKETGELPEEYMGHWFVDADGRPIVREDGCVRWDWVPAGFLKITTEALHVYAGAYPELLFGVRWRPHIDLFNHGAHDGLWYGEDYAFSRRWNEKCGEIWVRPDLDIVHYAENGTAYPGNFFDYLARQPGGAREGLPPVWMPQPTKSAA